ncbi:fluoride efflux transporter CrcB [Phenylobacterium sp.]|uniref:fluoride efflux transporter CrcB n=1 Tax=Phenylobacterium sp. TaxID=1871053 RepID=UPI0039830C75
MQALLLVGAGGALGAVARYLLALQANRWLGAAWPWGTLIANVAGSFAMGALAAWLTARGGDERWRLLLAVGLLGGFTTFSAYSIEIVQMIERRAHGPALAYSLGSVVLSVAALVAGLVLVRRVLT